MITRCPWCGSKDVANILRGLPAISDQLVQDMSNKKVIPGGCQYSDDDPTTLCNACGKEFGKPPYLHKRTKQEQNQTRELFPEIITGIIFYEGGYWGGRNFLEITSDNKGYHSIHHHYPEGLYIEDPPYTTELSREQWKRLINKLFNQLYVHEWKKRYIEPNVCDGTQWSLELKLTGRRHYIIHGSNKFPPLYKELIRSLKPYIKKGIYIYTGDD